jgi:Zn-finger nucleic acid-binding protein
MNCPGCDLPMTTHRLAANYGGEVEIDVCDRCVAIWFDRRESLQLSPGATLDLLKILGARATASGGAIRADARCPRCGGALLETTDLQRGTRFHYRRCDAHGRFITFYEFLREKNLVREPSPAELAAIRSRVKVVKCSHCGAPIDLAAAPRCSYCDAPVSVLSAESLRESLELLQRRDERRGALDAASAQRVAKMQQEIRRALRETDARGLGPPFLDLPSTAAEGIDLLAEGAEYLVKRLLRILQ